MITINELINEYGRSARSCCLVGGRMQDGLMCRAALTRLRRLRFNALVRNYVAPNSNDHVRTSPLP